MHCHYIFFSISDAPRHFYKAIVQFRSCVEDQKVWPTKTRNGIVKVSEWEHGIKYFQVSPYFAHCETMFLALLTDDDLALRLWAAERILKIRAENEESDKVRVWEKPTLMVEYNSIPLHYKDLIGKIY